MDLPDISFKKAEYIETPSGNCVSRQSVLCGSKNIVLNGKNIVQSEAIIRGDLANVRVGRHCIISSKAVIRPPFKKFSKGVAFFPLQIGDHVFIGEGSIVNAAVVSSYVYIGKNVIIGRRCVLKGYQLFQPQTYQLFKFVVILKSSRKLIKSTLES